MVEAFRKANFIVTLKPSSRRCLPNGWYRLGGLRKLLSSMSRRFRPRRAGSGSATSLKRLRRPALRWE